MTVTYSKEYYSILHLPATGKTLNLHTKPEIEAYRVKVRAYQADVKASGLKTEFRTEAEAKAALPALEALADKYGVALEICKSMNVGL